MVVPEDGYGSTPSAQTKTCMQCELSRHSEKCMQCEQSHQSRQLEQSLQFVILSSYGGPGRWIWEHSICTLEEVHEIRTAPTIRTMHAMRTIASIRTISPIEKVEGMIGKNVEKNEGIASNFQVRGLQMTRHRCILSRFEDVLPDGKDMLWLRARRNR